MYLLIYVLILVQNFPICLCSHTSAEMLLWSFSAIPLLSLQTKPPFPSAHGFLPTSSPPSSSPSLYAITFWRLSMEILMRFCLDSPFLMFIFGRPLPWSQYHSSYSSSAKHRKPFWHILLCILWHEETFNWFFWVLDLHSSVCFFYACFIFLGDIATFWKITNEIKPWEQKTVQNYFIYWLQKRAVASGKENPFIVLFLWRFNVYSFLN